MQYLRRAVKYLIYFLVIFFAIVGILWLINSLNGQKSGFAELFQPGSFPKLAIFFIAVSAVYPALGFATRKLYVDEFAAQRDLIVGVFEQMGYGIISEESGRIEFRFKSGSMRLSRMYEDQVILDTTTDPLEMSGYRRDVERIIRNVNYKLRMAEEENKTETEA